MPSRRRIRGGADMKNAEIVAMYDQVMADRRNPNPDMNMYRGFKDTLVQYRTNQPALFVGVPSPGEQLDLASKHANEGNVLEFRSEIRHVLTLLMQKVMAGARRRRRSTRKAKK